MNTDRLAKMYNRLTPKERLPLLLAAEQRGDETEHTRLASSAPAQFWRVPDYLPGLVGLNTLALIYLTEQLDFIANYWHAAWRLLDSEDEKAGEWLIVLHLSAYMFNCNAEAWRRCCEEHNLDTDRLIADNHCGWLLDFCTAKMPSHAPSREAIIAHLKSPDNPDPNPVTADVILAQWRYAFRLLAFKEEKR